MSTPTTLPPCGLYRTIAQIADVPAGRLVYFHNHGDPGPGLYLPEKWLHNRASFSPKGMTAPPGFDAKALRPLPREGFYRVSNAFFCCAKECTRFEPDALVQIGYNGNGQALLFTPELVAGAMTVPERGTFIDDNALVNLLPLNVAEKRDAPAAGAGDGGKDPIGKFPRGIIVH